MLTPKQHGLLFDVNGCVGIPRLIMGVTLVGYVVVGLREMRYLSTTSSLERRITLLQIVIFNQYITIATITRGVKDGNQ